MLVKAKCTAPAWDSESAMSFYPGEEYMIERDGKLASLTVTPVAFDSDGNPVRFYQDREGKIRAQKIPMPAYVFEFDRAAPGQDRDYTCEKCGEKCKTLNALGTHVHSKHPDPVTAAIVDEPANLPFVCKECPKSFKDNRSLKGHQRWAHKEKKAVVAETEPVPA